MAWGGVARLDLAPAASLAHAAAEDEDLENAQLDNVEVILTARVRDKAAEAPAPSPRRKRAGHRGAGIAKGLKRVVQRVRGANKKMRARVMLTV